MPTKVYSMYEIASFISAMYGAFAAGIAQYLPKHTILNGIAGTEVAVTLDEGGGNFVTKHIFLHTEKAEIAFPNEVAYSTEAAGTEGCDYDSDVDWDEIRTNGWLDSESDHETDLATGFCLAEPAA